MSKLFGDNNIIVPSNNPPYTEPEIVDLKTKTVCVVDNGLFVSWAIKLSEYFKKVYYFNPIQSDFPTIRNMKIGDGFKEITTISDIWGHTDEYNFKDVDLFIFPDCGYAGWQENIIAQGKLVWGTRYGEYLELWRWQSKQVLKSVGLPVGVSKKCIGQDELLKYLDTKEDVFVKVSYYRGDFETFHWINKELSTEELLKTLMGCGCTRFEMEFIVEDKIESDIENGYDGYCVDGEFPKTTTYGYEIKDKCYGCVVLPYDKLPDGVKLTNERLAPVLKEYGYRCDYHTEIRNQDKTNTPFLTDITCRKGSPPTSVLLELIDNWGEIIWYGSQGKLIEPKFNGKYGVEVIICSDWAVKMWQPLKIDKKVIQWTKLRNVCIKDGIYWTIPRENSSKEIGSVVAIGDTMDECIKKVNEYAEGIEGNNIVVNTKYIDELLEEIENGKKQGMTF